MFVALLYLFDDFFRMFIIFSFETGMKYIVENFLINLRNIWDSCILW